MFCTKCGKKIDYEASVCNECAGVGQWFNADAQPAPEVKVEAEQEINVNNDFNNAANQNANNGFYTDPNTNPYANQNYNTQYNHHLLFAQHTQSTHPVESLFPHHSAATACHYYHHLPYPLYDHAPTPTPHQFNIRGNILH